MLGLACALLAFLCAFVNPLAAQQGCPAPPLPTVSSDANIFNAQQEMDLGDAAAAQFQSRHRVTNDPQLTSYLQDIGGRLLKHLPPTGLKFQFFLIDLSYANAFSLPGGRVYVSTKIIALTRNEDELAGIIGHELGHIATHQLAIDVSLMLNSLLGVTQVSDRRDIFDKYNRMLENWRRKPEALRGKRGHAQEREEAADSVGLYAMAAAGYSPQATVDVFDRLLGLEGKTGGWLSDLLGTTRPDARRLRELVKLVQALPPDCVERAPTRPEEFTRWQAAVVSYSGWEHQEALHGVVATAKLQPELRSDITDLHFSPDSRYILAQDSASVYVLSRDPPAAVLQIDAQDAYPAQFSPDSKAVVFHTRYLRVETWDITEKKRTGVCEVGIPGGCFQSALAPDGRTLACLKTDYGLTLVDTASSNEIFRRNSFFKLVNAGPFRILMEFSLRSLAGARDFELIPMGFSPDARYFLAAGTDSVVAFDLSSREEISVPGSVKFHLSDGFVFVGPQRLVGKTSFDRRHSPILEFPSGKKLGEIALGMGKLSAPAHGDFVLLRPVKYYPVGVFDLASGKSLFSMPQSALDLYDNTAVKELVTGELGLYDTQTWKLLTRIALPAGRLGGLGVGAVSPDLKWFAASLGDRAAVWDLSTGTRQVYTHAFDGAYFDPEGWLYADFRARERTDRALVKVGLNSHTADLLRRVEDQFARQYGQFLVVTQPAKPNQTYRDVTEEIRDVRSGKTLWSRHFSKEAPALFVNPNAGTVVLAWGAGAGSVGDEASENPQVKERLSAARPEKGDGFLEVLDATNGKVLGSLVVTTGKGSFRVREASAAGDWVVVTDTLGRLLVYSLSTGEEKGRVFGSCRALSPRGGLLAVENETGHLDIYDFSALEMRDQFVFGSPIVASNFSEDGTRLLVVTSDQTAYTLDTSALAQSAIASAPPH
jgi:hypothetical protein